jgi:hypothetical protein
MSHIGMRIYLTAIGMFLISVLARFIASREGGGRAVRGSIVRQWIPCPRKAACGGSRRLRGVGWHGIVRNAHPVPPREWPKKICLRGEPYRRFTPKEERNCHQ